MAFDTEYPCCAPLNTGFTTATIATTTQCHGMMRLRDAALDEIPGMTVVTRVLVCDACGRAALPEEAESEQCETVIEGVGRCVQRVGHHMGYHSATIHEADTPAD